MSDQVNGDWRDLTLESLCYWLQALIERFVIKCIQHLHVNLEDSFEMWFSCVKGLLAFKQLCEEKHCRKFNHSVVLKNMSIRQLCQLLREVRWYFWRINKSFKHFVNMVNEDRLITFQNIYKVSLGKWLYFLS